MQFKMKFNEKGYLYSLLFDVKEYFSRQVGSRAAILYRNVLVLNSEITALILSMVYGMELGGWFLSMRIMTNDALDIFTLVDKLN
jgi:hypothetical protein